MLPLYVLVQIFYALIAAGYDVGLTSGIINVIAHMRFY